MIGITSRKAAQIPFIQSFLNAEVAFTGSKFLQKNITTVAGWGMKRSGKAAERLASKYGLDSLRLEDGFLRSFGSGEKYPSLSLIADSVGIYYDATRPSELENLLNSDDDVLAGIDDDVDKACQLVLENRLSKYNSAPEPKTLFIEDNNSTRVLVVDQTKSDLSIDLGLACESSFKEMLNAAREENPDAIIYVKTHPEVSSGRKQGHLGSIEGDTKTVLVRNPMCPMSLLSKMDRVYVVTSQMGFEALLSGKPVTCFGMPWYAGWGVTDDRQKNIRRTRERSLRELFAAAYFHYTRYLDPVTRKSGSIFDVIKFLCLQKERAARQQNGRTICVGFPSWKAQNILPFLSLSEEKAIFVSRVEKLCTNDLNSSDRLVCWGADTPPNLLEMSEKTGASIWHMEDGFFRSVGLGSDLIPPKSLVLDQTGMFFDPNYPSYLEELLNRSEFDEEDMKRAIWIREFIVSNALCKYNLEKLEPITWNNAGREVILVPGQVEDDASIRLGCESVKTNLVLLKAVRSANPNAFIVFKPHPDVFFGKRPGRIDPSNTLSIADYIEDKRGIISCIEACDAVHTMTSLAGFDALLRDKQVTVYGKPFYAGWGLTNDLHDFPRREKQLTLEQLVAGTLIRYPLYWDQELRGFTSCEAVLYHLRDLRDDLIQCDELKNLSRGYLRRQVRKLNLYCRSAIRRNIPLSHDTC